MSVLHDPSRYHPVMGLQLHDFSLVPKTFLSDIIVFLDSDMTVTPNFLSVHAEFHQNKSEAIGIGNIVWANEIPDNSLTRYVSNRGVHQTRISDEVPFKCFVTGNSSVPKPYSIMLGYSMKILERMGERI